MSGGPFLFSHASRLPAALVLVASGVCLLVLRERWSKLIARALPSWPGRLDAMVSGVLLVVFGAGVLVAA